MRHPEEEFRAVRPEWLARGMPGRTSGLDPASRYRRLGAAMIQRWRFRWPHGLRLSPRGTTDEMGLPDVARAGCRLPRLPGGSHCRLVPRFLRARRPAGAG